MPLNQCAVIIVRVLHELFKENTYSNGSRRGRIVLWPTASPTLEMPELYSMLSNVISATMSSGA